MPQIRCPNCGETISLENRREVDFNLITRTLRNGPKTFTQILHTTQLPRKTLSLRLKELIESETIVRDGGYRLNGASSSSVWKEAKLSRKIELNRRKIALMLLALIICIPIAAHVYASYMVPPTPPQPPPSEPTYTEVFTAKIVIHDVIDLYLWQVGIIYDPNVLVVINVMDGGFLNAKPPFFVWTTDSYLGKGGLLFCASLHGQVPGISGSGILATIEFGVIGEGSRKLQFSEKPSAFLLLNSMGAHITDASVTIET